MKTWLAETSVHCLKEQGDAWRPSRWNDLRTHVQITMNGAGVKDQSWYQSDKLMKVLFCEHIKRTQYESVCTAPAGCYLDTSLTPCCCLLSLLLCFVWNWKTQPEIVKRKGSWIPGLNNIFARVKRKHQTSETDLCSCTVPCWHRCLASLPPLSSMFSFIYSHQHAKASTEVLKLCT